MTSTAPVGRALRGVPGVGPPGYLRRAQPNEPIRPVAFLGVAIVSFGGPLALAALYAPTIVADASASAGLVTVSAAVVFGVPLLVWLRYSRHVATSGGLYGFVEAAAGRRVALAQAALWTASYLLYLLYTTASIVYDILPVVLPGVGPYQPLVEVALPLVLAAVMLAGRACHAGRDRPPRSGPDAARRRARPGDAAAGRAGGDVRRARPGGGDRHRDRPDRLAVRRAGACRCSSAGSSPPPRERSGGDCSGATSWSRPASSRPWPPSQPTPPSPARPSPECRWRASSPARDWLLPWGSAWPPVSPG